VNQPPNPAAPPPAALPGCWWHPNRPTGLSCSRCGRPACPDCLREAPVGFHCTDCVHAGTQHQRRARRDHPGAGFGAVTIFGARPSPKAVVVPVLVAINVLVYLFTVFQSGSIWDNDHSLLSQWGVLWAPAVLGGGEWWRLVTSGFLHNGLLHVAANMFSLWMMGRALEPVMGRGRFLALYFGSMLGASAANLLIGGLAGVPVAGASGAIFGLLGCYAVIVLKQRLNPMVLVVNLLLNVYITFQVPGISILAHVGGFVLGVLIAVALLYAPERNQVRWQATGIAILVVAMLVALGVQSAGTASVDCGASGQRYYCSAAP
jgi:membrane associated rhomboid family serine protease